jgi:hypothetical protein
MLSSGMLRLVALVRTDDSEEGMASIILATKLGELGTTLARLSCPCRELRPYPPACSLRSTPARNWQYWLDVMDAQCDLSTLVLLYFTA